MDHLKTDITVLVVSYYFPPDAAVGGKRIARFCKYLLQLGIKPIVLTVDQSCYELLDASYPVPDGVTVHRVQPEKVPLDFYREWKARGETVGTAEPNLQANEPPRTQKGSWLRNNLLAALTIPDQYWGWKKPALIEADSIFKKSKIDAIFSSGPPWTTHRVAQRISRLYSVPWIADFRDAWVSDQWRDEQLPRWRDSLDWRLEESCLKQATSVVCTTEQLKQSLSRAHPGIPAEKLTVISNGFDGELPDHKMESVARNEAPILLHAGQLYSGRRIDSFCRAIGSLIRSGRLKQGGLLAQFLGDIDQEILEGARAAAPELFENGTVSMLPPVGWKEVQERLQQADILLIVQGDHPTAIPAKFFEYLQTGKPILGIAQEGALRETIQQTGCGLVADPRRPDEMEAAILQVLEMKPQSAEQIRNMAGRYHFRELTIQLASHIREAVATSVTAKHR